MHDILVALLVGRRAEQERRGQQRLGTPGRFFT
jgi:hypothetical protein